MTAHDRTSQPIRPGRFVKTFGLPEIWQAVCVVSTTYPGGDRSMTRFPSILLLVVLIYTAVYAQHHHTGTEGPRPEKSEKTELIDEFGSLGHCDLTSRFDNFFAELSNRPSSVGYVLVYQKVDALPADYDAPPMARFFTNHLAFRNFDPSRVTVVNAGFQTGPHTQLWIVPPGGEIPTPSDTLAPPVIPTDRTFLYDSDDLVADESGESLRPFELAWVREEREQQEAQTRAELQSDDDARAPATENSDEAEEQIEDEYVDERSPEEIEADRFSWVSEKFGNVLKTRKEASGVIVFYADDQTLDIGMLTDFIQQGKKRLTDKAELRIDRISVRFGGYRNFPEVEYWVVPPKGADPVATPSERPIEEPEHEADSPSH